ncbi:MAG: hypothetical protein WKF68_02840 [Daejeonella sp.]
MIETSTPTTNSLQNNMVQNNPITEDIGEDEQLFYASIKKNLDALARNPGQEIIAKILNYSKSV